MNMSVAMMQPAFMPWLGFFELIYKADKFIFLDDFQFSVQSYHQRNRLFVNKSQVDWYSVPVKKVISFKAALNQTQIDESILWRNKMWKRIQQNYSRANYFSVIVPYVEEWLKTPFKILSDQNIAFIRLVCQLMGLQREFILSSDYPADKKSSRRVLDLLNLNNAQQYYCAHGSFGYMYEEAVFPVESKPVFFQNFQMKEYKQVGSSEKFIPFLSILDALMNIGPLLTLAMIKNGTTKWLSWDDMVKLYGKRCQNEQN